MFHLRYLSLEVALLLASGLINPAQAAPSEQQKCVAAFDFELIDLSLEGEIKGVNSAEQQRLVLISEQLRNWLVAEGHQICDMAPVAAEARAANLYGCGCVQKLASRVDAGLAVTGVVQKVSNLILNIEIDAFDVTTDRPHFKASAQFRANTDRSWKQGLDWLIKHRLTAALGRKQ
jgi:Protein of unknown function (DUF2380)